MDSNTDNRNPFFDIKLPKWPEMRVIGDNVTIEQAMEIILRTDDASSHICVNDIEWSNTVSKVLGVPIYDSLYVLSGEEYEKNRNIFDKKMAEYKNKIKYIDDIDYIRPDRIGSSYVGGSHGWVNWDGTIGTCGHNVGKWPSVGSIYDEWKIVAREFPYLNLRCQLFSGENCEKDTSPLIEFVVKNGEVEMKMPTESLPYNKEWGLDLECNTFIFNERYCTVKNLKDALKVVTKKAVNIN